MCLMAKWQHIFFPHGAHDGYNLDTLFFGLTHEFIDCAFQDKCMVWIHAVDSIWGNIRQFNSFQHANK